MRTICRARLPYNGGDGEELIHCECPNSSEQILKLTTRAKVREETEKDSAVLQRQGTGDAKVQRALNRGRITSDELSTAGRETRTYEKAGVRMRRCILWSSPSAQTSPLPSTLATGGRNAGDLTAGENERSVSAAG